MKTIVILVLATTIALGLSNLFAWMRGARKPLMIGAHLLFAIGGLESFVAGGGAAGGVGGQWGPIAAGLLAAALFCGLLGAIIRKNARGVADVLLATHAILGVLGFVAVLGWAFP